MPELIVNLDNEKITNEFGKILSELIKHVTKSSKAGKPDQRSRLPAAPISSILGKSTNVHVRNFQDIRKWTTSG